MKATKPLFLFLSLVLLIGVAVFHLMDSPAHREDSPDLSQNSQQDESEKESPANPEPVSDSGLSGDDPDKPVASDETPERLLPSQVAGRVFPKVDLNVLAFRLPREEFAVFERTRLEFPEVDWTEIEPTHQAFLNKRAEFPLNLNDHQREAYAAWLGEVEPMSRTLIKLRAEAHGLSAGGMEGDQGYYIDGFRDGVPVYVVTANVGAATTTGASYVRWNPGFDPALGDTINGGEFYMNVNDHGEIYEHTEFQLPNGGGSRIMVKEVPWYDGGNRNHMTHVAGTMAAWGYNSSLEGMAPRSWIRSLIQQSTSHITTYGMATPGQQMNVTNPRTGKLQLRSVVGNTSLGTADPYNRYNSTSATYDNILRDHPYYMHFNSTGNSGSHGYESLTGAWKIAKNMIGIGNATAVTRDADGVYVSGGNIAGSSSRGPTYDGRINPDFVAKGSSVTSTTGTTGSSTYTGTSMSSPNASGSVALLMDYVRQRLPQEYLRSSTYRALLATTAEDRGNPGPDYIYGWGILNVHAAAKIVREQAENPSLRLIIEDSLAPSQTWTETYITDGTQPIRVTIAWLDPASTNTDANSRASRLVNDLDLRLIGPDGTEHMPYVMPFTTGQGATPAFDPSLYNAHAVQGDNTTDPVEQVYIAAPADGIYTVQVTHKGNLLNNQAQPFSVAVSGLTNMLDPLIEVARGGSTIDVKGIDPVSGTSSGTGRALTYTISNVGGGELELTTPVTISGQSNCSVTVNTQPSGSIIGGNSSNLDLTVTPTANGTWSFGVSIANNDPDKDPYHWTVTGISGSSATVFFTPNADTYIHNQNTGSNYGTSNIIYLNHQTGGGNPSSRDTVRGLLRFDLSSIPSDTIIESATLDFVQDNGSSGPINIVEATTSWDETEANWSNSNLIYGSTSFGSANTGTTAGAAVPTITLNSAGLAKVQNWVNNPSGNHGFGITAAHDGRSQSEWLALRSREHSTEAHRPRLSLTYAGASVDAPLMTVSGVDGFIANGGSEVIQESEAAAGTQLTYAIQNFGSANLTLTTPVDVGATSNCSVTVNTQPASPVAISGSTNLVLTVTPTASGSWSATVSIANNDADKNPYTWTISGTASKSQATLTLNGLEQTYDGSPRGVTATTSPAGLDYTITYDGQSQPPVNAGSYEIIATITDPDFEGSETDTLVVAKAGQTITFAPLDSVSMDDEPFPVSATASSGLPVSFTSSNPSVATISGNIVTPVAVGSTTITASQAGDANFEPAPDSPQTLSVFAEGQVATGGEIAFIDGYYVHTFTQGGSFEIIDGSTINVEVLVVGGGGGGGSSTAFGTAGAGGGGAGGLIYEQAVPASGTVSVVVGSPGARAGSGNTPGNNGGNSEFGSLVALGGGGGSGGNMQGLAGGSGGGSRGNTNGGAGNQPTSSSGGFGNAGGGWPSGGGDGAGGGGGAGQAAPSAPPHDPKVGGPGGNGLAFDISGTLITYAGGGGGGASGTSVFGSGGQGGGGSGANNDTPATPGAPNTGGGGGGGNNSRVGADGGSGIVIVRYPGNASATTYTVSYDGNGNTGGTAPTDQTKEEDVDLILSGPGTLERTGYNFTGWNTVADGSGTSYAAGATYTDNTSATLYAQWTLSGALAVTGGNLESTGTFGGPFNPSFVEYTLENTGSESIDWTAGKTANWVSLSATNGTLAPQETTTVTVSINANADTLAPDAYSDTLTFNNLTNGLGDTTRSVSLTVDTIPVEVTLGALAQTYDGDPKPVTVITDPTPVAYTITYDGEPDVPVNSGSYAVVVTVTEPNHTGSASNTLVITKATQTITFAPLDPVEANVGSFELAATASSELPVSYSSSDPSVATISGNMLTVVGAGETTITASQEGDANFEAATPVGQPLTVLPADLAGALIYEPFDDADATLNGNASGLGLSGNWQATAAVEPGSLNFGDLPEGSGNKAVISNQYGAVEIDGSLAAAGLLDDGAELWFSMLVHTGGDIGTNGDLGFAFGSERINSGNNIPVQNNGTALGFTFKNNQLRASLWTPGAISRSGTNSGNGASPDTLYLVVGKFTWGAESDTLEIFNVGEDLAYPTAVSTYTTSVDQSQFDTISFGSKAASPAHMLDEIRFGATYWDVIGQGETASAPIDSFAITGIPSSVTVGSEITGITLTALSADAEIATSFTGTVTFGGSAGITGTSASFVDGVLGGVSITPSVVGDGLTFTVDDGAGHTGSATFDVVSVFNDWADSHGLTGEDAEPGAILQPDGLTNLQKFAFGMNPTATNFNPVQFVVGGEMTAPGSPTLMNMAGPGQPDDERAVFTRLKNHAAAGLTYIVDFSADLKIWTTSDATPTVLTDENNEGDLEVVSVPFSDAVPVADGEDQHPPKFMRVTVSSG